MRAVNLLPRDERRARFDAGRHPLLLAAGGIVVVTAASVFLANSASGTATERQAELEAVEATIARLPRSPGAAVSERVLVQERTDRVAALSAALSNRVSFDRLLREVSFVFPEDAWLTQLEANAPLPAAPVAEGAPPVPQSSIALQGVTIQGATYTHDSVAVVLARLSVVPSLADVRLSATALVEPQAGDSRDQDGQSVATRRGKPFVTFVVTAALRTGASR